MPPPNLPTRTGLTLLLAALTMVGPLAIDIYVPSLPALAREFGAGPVLMQQTLSLFLGGFSLMMLFYGALADSFGRRPVILLCRRASKRHFFLKIRLWCRQNTYTI